MNKYLLGIALALLLWGIFFRAPSPPPPGIRIDAVPLQNSTTRGSWREGEFEIRPLARYQLKARVLAKKRYFFDAPASLAPYDLVLGWEGMSDSTNLEHISIDQSDRWYEYFYTAECPLDGDEIVRESANTHCLPGNDEVRSFLKGLDRHSFVELGGYLVEVRKAGQAPWSSSLMREDTGQGSCEIFWIEEARRILP